MTAGRLKTGVKVKPDNLNIGSIYSLSLLVSMQLIIWVLLTMIRYLVMLQSLTQYDLDSI